MIYSKFGSKLMLITKTQSDGGRVSVQVKIDETANIHEYDVVDLKADDGINEINEAAGKLPWRAITKSPQRGHKNFRQATGAR